LARRKVWIPFNSGFGTAASTSTHLDLLTNMAPDLEAAGGLTVLRMVGELKYRIDTVGTYQQFNVGIGVFTEELPTSTDMTISGDARDWLWTLMTRTSGYFIEVASGDFDGVEEVRFIDVHAMRKIPANSQLRVVTGNGAGVQVNFNLGLRILVALP